MSKIVSDKSVLRQQLLAQRQAIAAEVRTQWNTSINTCLIQWWESHRLPVLGVFWPIRGEPDLRPAYLELAARGARLALPVVKGKDCALAFIDWKPGDPMVKDAFGVAVPAAGAIVVPEALLIPCVGFNKHCFRIGYGGGMFDRTLAVEPRPLAVGVSYACGLTDFEADSHDVGMDMVLTESAVMMRGQTGAA